MTATPSLRGGCHCGNLVLSLATAQEPATTHPRACDCAFCVKHGAGWLSDPTGRLSIDVHDHAYPE